ncbi:flagellar biosynthesis protein FlhF [Evansella tamaricis]|uniref:Flagellar biosynthesis protein FlhF n=1 Tax=Evansella tamaricis TaxID=2069301 RepID=A0ABS6JLJ4_9BACI|nr:flagellar biosynthesis protein FlhF [Evansella tamaricis]MBU9714535.1 flagellar biosynthesis protein FlhF [Evansella tamaricis]
MKVKKIIANTMPEAMTKVKEELGSNAVILNSKNIDTGGFLGFFTKKKIEVIAAIDPKPQPKERKKLKGQQNTLSSSAKRRSEQNNSEWKDEITELKKMIQHQRLSMENYPGYLKELNDILCSQEIGDVHRINIMDNLVKRWYSQSGERKSETELLHWLKEGLKEYIQSIDCGPFSYNKRFLNLVGPTGVGKTTTLAKIAAKAALVDKKKVAFITTDTYRIAAINQLKTYGEILNAPVEVAYSVEDFQLAKNKLKDYDFILVDSAGRNFRNTIYVEQLRKVIDFSNEMETHLVLSLTSKYRDMKKIIEQFQLIEIDKVIFTKADETDTFGVMVNVFADYKLGYSYITNGQNVPDDILVPTSEMVVNHVVRR